MTHLDPDRNELVAKVVYYGPDRSGKTTCLDFLFEKYRHRVDAQEVMIKSVTGKPLFFDFFPLDVGKIKGWDVKIQFYTVPGGEKHRAARRVVLKGVDGVVFVADSMLLRRENNIKSLRELEASLAGLERDAAPVPLVFQYNKRDLEGSGIPLLSTETLNQDLNSRWKSAVFPTSGLTGENVIAAMKKVIILAVSRAQASVVRSPGRAAPLGEG